MVLKENKKQTDGKKEKTDIPDTPEADEQKNSDEGNDPENKDDHEGLEDQLSAQKEKVLRLSAEFENFKKRKQREIDEFKKFANETIFRQLLSVVDNLERAIDSATDAVDETSLLEGVKLTHKELLKLFESFNVTLVEAEDKPLTPIFIRPSPMLRIMMCRTILSQNVMQKDICFMTDCSGCHGCCLKKS